MAATSVGILSPSGWGKTTSIVINPDGKYNPAEYAGMIAEETVIINSDRKRLPFPLAKHGWVAGQNYFEISNISTIQDLLLKISAGSKIKSVIIDTINGVMLDAEMLESKKLTFDKWYDFAKDIYELIVSCNMLRNDLIIYLLGHVSLLDDIDGNPTKCLTTNGKKLKKIELETKMPIVLYNKVERAGNDATYFFETQANRSTGKSPIGLFDTFLIPNSLKLVDTKIREYYSL